MKLTLIEIEGAPSEILAVVERLPGCTAAHVQMIAAQIEAGENPGPLVIAHDTTNTGETPVSARLSKREQQILYYLMEGVSNKAIADALDCAEQTVKAHIKSILGKIGVQNRTKAALWAQRHLGNQRPALIPALALVVGK